METGLVVVTCMMLVALYVLLGLLTTVWCVEDPEQIAPDKRAGYVLLWPVTLAVYLIRSVSGAWMELWTR